MKRLLLPLLFFFSFPAFAEHIVGGEFEFLFLGENAEHRFRYNLNMVLYFDLKSNPGAFDPIIRVRIFRKRDNVLMVDNIRLDYIRTKSQRVEYFRPTCSNGTAIETYSYFYSVATLQPNGDYEQADLILDPDAFDDPQGYYISWERCCRNYTITNVFSSDPNVGTFAGQTFYLEFPPMKKNGQPFYNSSPYLFKPLSDYACPGRFYWVDFTGTDADGDSLAYSMEVPLNTHSGEPLPFPTNLPNPGPYPVVNYKPGFSINNIAAGNPDLKISTDGLLTVTPTQAGLYVFAVKCAEFRDGVKIGEIRRDFQLLVLSSCPPATKPVLEGKKKDDTQFSANALSVSFSNQITDENRCIDIRVTDPDAASRSEEIEILAVSVNFDEDVDEVLPEISTDVLQGPGDAAMFSVCFPQCPYTKGKYLIDIIVQDGSCPLPLMDTITVEVDVELPPNASPQFNTEKITATVLEGSGLVTWNFSGTDGDDGDTLRIIQIDEEEMDLAEFGFSYTVNEVTPNNLTGQLIWDTSCRESDFIKEDEFHIQLELDDQDKCEVTPSDTLTFDLKMDLYDIHIPEITYVPDPTSNRITLDRKIHENISFNVKGHDQNANEKIIMRGQGIDFDMATYNATFPAIGFFEEGTSTFTWPLTCTNVNPFGKDEFEFMFEVVDENNRCGYRLSDTLWVTINVGPPDNNAPEISINNQTSDLELDYTLGDEITLPILGTDNDIPSDMLNLELMNDPDVEKLVGYTFNTTAAPAVVNGIFSWKPECSVFKGNDFENEYTLRFRVQDARCFVSSKSDEITVKLNLKDVESADAEFLPPNIITPNGDGKNEFFAMVKEDPDHGGFVSILPLDNCKGVFHSILIYNRWGREVFYSTDRDFRWHANNDPTGMYFYQLMYSHKEYKGIITVAGESQHNR
jgi:hypothetical protein